MALTAPSILFFFNLMACKFSSVCGLLFNSQRREKAKVEVKEGEKGFRLLQTANTIIIEYKSFGLRQLTTVAQNMPPFRVGRSL